MAKKKTTKKDENKVIEIQQVVQKTITLHVIGKSPLICNSMSQKTWQELLYPNKRKTQAQREQVLKHEPLREYRDSVYMLDEGQPTAIGVQSTSFKNAIRCVAVDLEGSTKAQMGRATFVDGGLQTDKIPVFGIPEMFMSIVRQAGQNRAPDVRTRAIIPNWACIVNLTYTSPILTQKTCVDLFAAAGFMQGIGDWRVEKGSGSFGRFDLVDKDDPTFLKIVEMGGREAQLEALDSPEFYDDETSKIYEWFEEELERRGDDEKLTTEKAVA